MCVCIYIYIQRYTDVQRFKSCSKASLELVPAVFEADGLSGALGCLLFWARLGCS